MLVSLYNELEKLWKLCEGICLNERNGLVVNMDKGRTTRGMTKLDLVLMGNTLGNKVVSKDEIEYVID